MTGNLSVKSFARDCKGTYKWCCWRDSWWTGRWKANIQNIQLMQSYMFMPSDIRPVSRQNLTQTNKQQIGVAVCEAKLPGEVDICHTSVHRVHTIPGKKRYWFGLLGMNGPKFWGSRPSNAALVAATLQLFRHLQSPEGLDELPRCRGEPIYVPPAGKCQMISIWTSWNTWRQRRMGRMDAIFHDVLQRFTIHSECRLQSGRIFAITT